MPQRREAELSRRLALSAMIFASRASGRSSVFAAPASFVVSRSLRRCAAASPARGSPFPSKTLPTRGRPMTEAAAASATTSAATSTGSGGIIPSLANRNLVSVRDCLDAFSTARRRSGDGGRGEGGGGLVFVDGSWYHRGGRNGRTEFEAGPRIPGAKYVDMDDIAAQKSLFPELNPKDLPHMLPPKDLFATSMDAFGIRNSDHIVVYGKDGCIFTPRTWFLFRSMGHDPTKVHLMQGSLEEWAEMGGDVDTERVTVPKAKELLVSAEGETPKYRARDAAYVCDMSDVARAIESAGTGSEDDAVILDPRGTTFARGHMPGAVHVPYRSIVTADDALKFKSKEELLAVLDGAGVDVRTEKKIICSCGSGVSVCHLFVALEECGRDCSAGTVIYDGSWTEWGADPDTSKVASQTLT